jgi:pimeloyl-ACP methyl ester carboxylesterase
MTRVLLLPGLASDAALWRAQIDALARAGHEPVVTDVHARHPSLAQMAQALLAEQAGPLVLAGTSMGGMLALEVWRQAPARVAGLALLGTSARADTPEVRRLRTEAIALFEAGRMAEVLQANLPFVFHARHQRDLAIVSDYFDMIGRAGAAQLVAQNRAILAREDRRSLLGAIRVPVLVACGADDVLTPPECSREIAQAVPGAVLEVLGACGHLLTWDQPEAVSRLLLQWLERIDASPPDAPPG